MRWLLAFSLALASTHLSEGGDAFPEDLSAWMRTSLTSKNQGYWQRANHDFKTEWIVFLRGDRPCVRLKTEEEVSGNAIDTKLPFEIEPGMADQGLAGRRLSVKVSDGWMVGFNAGEWGGALSWFSPDGKERSRISRDQVNKFIKTDAGLLAMEGLAHMGSSRGKIIRIAKGDDEAWHSEPVLDLKAAPYAASLAPDGNMLVASSGRLLRVHLDSKKVDVLLEKVFSDVLYPDSMICTPTGTIYVGMRHGVAEVKKVGQSYEVKWLVPTAGYDGEPDTPRKKAK